MTQIIDKILKSIEDDKQKIQSIKKIEIDKIIHIDDFSKMFILEANNILLSLGKESHFLVDDTNRELLNQLKLWLYNSKKCEYNLNKGFLLLGSVGIGKTLILETFCKLYTRIAKEINFPIIKIYNSRELIELVKTEMINLKRVNIFIDDLGKEPNLVKNYGTAEKPIAELFYYRSRYNSFTFATANYNMERFAEFYGSSIADRFIEIFNIIEIKGESKRK